MIIAATLGATAAMAQTAVGPAQMPGTPVLGVQDAASQTAQAAVDAFGPLASDAQGTAVLQEIVAKWSVAMRELYSWNDDSIAQFMQAYKNYPVSVLEKARAADTYEDMQKSFTDFETATTRANLAKAINLGKTTVQDLAPEVLQLRKTVLKALGDDGKDLVYIPTAPCGVWDTRFASAPPFSGQITPGSGGIHRFYSHLLGNATDFSPYGGSPAGLCNENNVSFLGIEPYAVAMIVYTSNADQNGWLTFFRDGDPDPGGATITVYYSPGPTRSTLVTSKSNRGPVSPQTYGTGTYDVAVSSRFGTVDASASVVGYFLKPAATALDCTEVTAVSPVVHTGQRTFAQPACAAGYSVTGGGVNAATNDGQIIEASRMIGNGWFSAVLNNSGGDRVYTFSATCCRVPGH
jgi:hypothetical protein